MTIKEVSEKFDLSTDTLRYYERIGLIPPVPRNKNGIRDYDENSCNWISLMKCFRKAGMQIESLVEYVSLFREGEHTLEARKQILIEQREKLLENMENLKISLETLDMKISNYEKLTKDFESKLK